MVTLHEVITFLVSMQISISSLQTHNVNRCGRSRHLARKLSLRRKRSSPNVFEMAATETITSIILIKLIRVSLGTVRHPRRFKIVVVRFYVAKYVNKKSDMDLAAKGLGAKEWHNSLKTKLSLLPKKLFRIRMSRNFGMKMLTMTNLSTECLIQLTKLGYDATPFNQILKQNAKREMRLRLGKVTVADVLAAQPVTTNLLKFMRASIKMIGVSNLQSFIASMTQKLTLSDIS